MNGRPDFLAIARESKMRTRFAPVSMRVRAALEFVSTKHARVAEEFSPIRRSTLPQRVTELRNLTRVFSLTILFDDNIQRTNCDDVMSQ
jgi:hypothetical protein